MKHERSTMWCHSCNEPVLGGVVMHEHLKHDGAQTCWMTNTANVDKIHKCERHEIRPGTVFLTMTGTPFVVASIDDLGLVWVRPEGKTVQFLMDPREIRDNELLTIVACGIG